jgi:replicative DNA helicase
VKTDYTKDIAEAMSRALTREQVFHNAMEEISRYQKGEVVGLPWPKEWPSVTRHVGPIVPGSLVVIGAKTSHGKTIAGQQITRRITDAGATVLYVTLELTPERLMQREFAYHGADLKRLRTKGGMTEADWQAITRVQDEMKRWAECWYLTASSVAEVDAEVRKLKPSCVLVDYIQRITYEGKDEYHALTHNMNALQDITLRHKVPVVLLSQSRRAENAREQYKRMHASDLRGSGAIEERAATILIVHRIYEADPDNADNMVKTDKGFIFIEKNADGEAGNRIPVTFRDGRFEIREVL